MAEKTVEAAPAAEKTAESVAEAIKRAMKSAREVYEATGSKSKGGEAGHAALGAPLHGPDHLKGGLLKEYAFSFNPKGIPQKVLGAKNRQSFKYALQMQDATGLVPIRRVTVMNPITGEVRHYAAFSRMPKSLPPMKWSPTNK